MEVVTVKFEKPCGAYRIGDLAGVSLEIAQKLEESEAARRLTTSELKAAKDARAKKLEADMKIAETLELNGTAGKGFAA